MPTGGILGIVKEEANVSEKLSRVEECAERRPAVGEGRMTWVSNGTERGWTDLARDSACDGDGDDDTQTHGHPFRFG